MSDLEAIKQANVVQKKRPSPLKEEVADVGIQVKQRASEAFQTSAEAARDKFGEAADAAKGGRG